jgi:predicted ATP-dependent endonuclease of OLD family
MLNKLKIANIRSFLQTQTLEFSLPDTNNFGSGLNIIVGQNNSGKSTLARSIRNFFSNQQTFPVGLKDRRDPNRPLLEFEWINEIGRKSFKIIDSGNGGHFNKTEGSLNIQSKVRYIPSRRPWAHRFNAQPMNQVAMYEMNDFNNRKSQENYVDHALSNALSNILLDNNKKNEFMDLIQHVDSNITDISLDIDELQDIITFKRKNSTTHSMAQTGDGIFSIIRIIFTIVASEKNDTIIIDEPELSLHPQAQKNLASLIEKASKDRQFLIFSHSPYFINWRCMANGGKISRIFLDDSGNSIIKTASKETLEAIHKIAISDIKNRKLYDTICKEFFFSMKSIFVEGPEDVHYIQNYIGPEREKDIPLMGYGCGGSGNIIHWLRLARDLSIKSVAIFDGNKKSDYDLCKTEFSEEKSISVEIIETQDIRDKYIFKDGKETAKIQTEGIFDRAGNIKPDRKAKFDALLNTIETF